MKQDIKIIKIFKVIVNLANKEMTILIKNEYNSMKKILKIDQD